MYFLLVLIFFVLLGEGVSIAQTKINGEVLDYLGKPLSHASVLLLSPVDSTLILGAVSGESGHFQFHQVKQDNYLLSVSLVGHQKYVEKIKVTRNSNVVLHPITLDELVDDLDEVIVAAQKPLYEKQIDRIVINVQESITAAGNSVLEVLQKSPVVIINRQNNSILLNGKSGVSVMINNKLSRLPMDVVVQMLDGLSAANIEKIELISNPPSKYDAEGTGGNHPSGDAGKWGFWNQRQCGVNSGYERR